MVLSALLFIEMTCEVVWTKLNLGNLKTKILGGKCQNGREHPESLACSSPPTRLWRVAFVSTRLWRADHSPWRVSMVQD